jgi:3-oxoacyl-[acyl-carrier-protein] synthase-1
MSESLHPVITGYTGVNCLGAGLDAILAALRAGTSGLRPCDFPGADFDTWIGRVEGLEDSPITGPLARYDCRNSRLALMALQADDFVDSVSDCIGRRGARRVGLVLGTSTSGIQEGERAFMELDADGNLPAWFDYRHSHDVHATTEFVGRLLGIEGPTFTVSTACSSSAKVFADAAQLIDHDICDAVLVGGVDSLCLLTLYGFRSLELTSPDPCRPNDAHRTGLSIGEGGGFALVERPRGAADALAVLEGTGESSDAFHMSSPHPEGLGASRSMQAALESADIKATAVGYINLHGTGSKVNDLVESRAVTSLFGNDIPCSSTKGWTGHTLGAAGITEAVISLLALREGFLPGNLGLKQKDPEIETNILSRSEVRDVRHVLSNSFGFGGNNCSLLFGRTS